MKTSTKVFLSIILLSAAWLTYWKFFIRDKDPYVQFLKVQKYCNEWDDNQKHLNKPMVYHIHKGEATLTMPTHRMSGVPFIYKSDGFEIINDTCMPNRIHYRLPMRDLGVENHKNLPMTWDKVSITIDSLQYTRQKHMELMEEKIKPLRDERKYQPQIAMKHFPLWFYRDFHDKDRHGFGLMHYNNPLTNRPHVIGCDFGQPDKNHDETTYQMIINAKQTHPDSIVPCGSYLYVVTPQAILVAYVALERDAVPYANEIFLKVEEQLTSFLSTPTN